MQFLRFWIMVFGHFRAGRIFYGSKIGQISPGTNFYGSSPFPKKNGASSVGVVLDLQQNMWVYAKSRKLHILLKCCFCCFCCFFGQHHVVFQKVWNLNIFSICTLLGKFSTEKKLWHIESRIGVRSSPIFDDFIFECYQVTKKILGEPKGTSNDLQNYNFFGYFKLILALEMILNTLSPKIIAWWRFCN